MGEIEQQHQNPEYQDRLMLHILNISPPVADAHEHESDAQDIIIKAVSTPSDFK